MKGPTTLRNRYASVRCRAKRMEARLPPVIFLQKQVLRRTLDDLTLLLRSFASLRGGLAARRVCYIIPENSEKSQYWNHAAPAAGRKSRRVGQKSFATGTRVRSITSVHWGPQHL